MDEGVLAILIGLVTVVMGIGVVFWAIYWAYRKTHLQYRERQLMIEKGMEPPALLPEQQAKKPPTPEESLRRGMIMVFLGIGFGIGYFILRSSAIPDEAPPAWLLGLAGSIVGLLGIGNLAYYFIWRRHKTEEPVGRA